MLWSLCEVKKHVQDTSKTQRQMSDVMVIM
jgi:hypothetical protein